MHAHRHMRTSLFGIKVLFCCSTNDWSLFDFFMILTENTFHFLLILKLGGRIRQAYTRQPLWWCHEKDQSECELQPMGASPSGWCHDASDSTRSVFCIQHGGCATSCTDGSNGQPAAGFHVSAAATAAADGVDDRSTTATAFKSFWKPIWSNCPSLWLRYARSSLQSLFGPYLDAFPKNGVLCQETTGVRKFGREVGFRISSMQYRQMCTIWLCMCSG